MEDYGIVERAKDSALQYKVSPRHSRSCSRTREKDQHADGPPRHVSAQLEEAGPTFSVKGLGKFM